jgi:hypothetical protein
MAGHLTVRFQESQRYDITADAEIIQFLATTEKGSYWTELIVEGPRSLRRDRERFKERAVEYIRAGANPCFIALEDTEQ